MAATTTDFITIIENNNGNKNHFGINGTNNHDFEYFKLGSLTRRHSVIGCIGFEFAIPNLSPQLLEEEEYNQKQEKEEKEEKEKYECNQKQEKEEKEKYECNQNQEQEENSCAICLEQQECKQTKNLATTQCGHTFCLTCLLSHLKHNNSCPLCRAPIEENAKKPTAPITYDDGVMLLNYELSSLRIEENIREQIDALIEISGNSQTNGADISSVADELMTMVASFGFNLLYDALCHMHHGEENVDPEWQREMNGSDDDDDGSSDYSSDDEDDNDNDDDDSEGNLTTVSSSSDEDEDDDIQKEGSGGTPWGNMYQLPPVNID